MQVEWLPILAFFLATVAVVMVFHEIGYRLGLGAHRKSADEKEAAISGVAGSVLGLGAFLLAFVFSTVSDRYQDRKALVRDDANAIRIAWTRADFLPEPDRAESKQLLRQYLDERLATAEEGSKVDRDLGKVVDKTEEIDRRLWRIAVDNARKDMNSDVAALYIESLNELSAVHTHRLAKVRARIPLLVWVALLGLTSLGMISMGYRTGLVESSRSKATPIVAVSFAMIIAMAAALDRPDFVRASQLPLVELQRFMDGGSGG